MENQAPEKPRQKSSKMPPPKHRLKPPLKPATRKSFPRSPQKPILILTLKMKTKMNLKMTPKTPLKKLLEMLLKMLLEMLLELLKKTPVANLVNQPKPHL